MENRRAVCGSHGAPAGAAVPVWGWSEWGRVTVQFAGQSKRRWDSSSGKWKVWLDAMKASAEARTMTMSSKSGAKAEIRDVLVARCALRGAVEHGDDGGWADEVAPRRRHRQCQGGGAGDRRIRFCWQFLVEWKTDTRPQRTALENGWSPGRDDGKFFSDGVYFSLVSFSSGCTCPWAFSMPLRRFVGGGF